MANFPQNVNGQAIMANSSPVVISSDQSAVSVTGNQTATTLGTWNSATGLNTALTISILNLNTVSLATVATSTFTGGVLTFEVSPDNANWFPIMMARIDSFTTESVYTLIASTNRAWSTSVDGFTNFRVRLSTVIAGTGSLTLLLAAQAFAIEPIVTVGQSIAANLQATVQLAAGSALAGKVGVDQTTPGTTNAVQTIPGTTGGLTTFHLVSAATTNLTNIKNAAGMVYGWYIYNSNAAARKVAFHNLSTTPVAGASIFMTLVIPPTSGANVYMGSGIAFSTGIGISTVTDLTDAGTTAVALNDLIINIFYK